MNKLTLVLPTKEHEKQLLDYVQEHREIGEEHLHGASLLEESPNYDDWLERIAAASDPTIINPDWVTATTFLAVRTEDQKIVGIINIRHFLNDFLRNYGGHIGYGVRPSERQKGYAGEMLRRGLLFCNSIGLEKVMITCTKNNIASRKTILSAGGVLEREFLHTDGEWVQVYWIELGE
ncbi:GNAT family N-acetyltransferase [Enterococcus viikkiensis]|uniref:GNAT family N-acetyltransferase n=1 Tax=Enterococcus viikkiensis TaxID=930854 RepID=UPI0010FA1E94|nr:GNAT family N-acetyltransferase [Enterococcus viikkiensis]